MNNDTYQIPPGMLMKAILNEKDKIVHYEYLCSMITDQTILQIIEDIIKDETDHHYIFINLFIQLFGYEPEPYDGAQPQFFSFIDGVKQAIVNESTTYDFYRNIYNYDQNTEVRNTFYKILTEEDNHYIKMNNIYKNYNGNY